MADRRPPSPFDADDRSPRHLRVDDRPIVRDLDDRQLAAEAVAALRAEHRPGLPDDLIPFDPPPAASDQVPVDPASGRHRRNIRPSPSPEDRHTREARPVDRSGAAAAPAAAGHRPPRVAFSVSSSTPPTVPRPHRRIDPPRGDTAPSAPPAGSTGGADPHPARRPVPGRGVLLVAALIVVLMTVLAVVVLADSDDAPTTVGTPPAAGATTSAPASTHPGTARVGGLGSPAPGTAVGDAATTSIGRPDPTATSAGRTADSSAAGGIIGPATGPVPRTPPPAVVSTLSPGDAGFGWPSTAFGRPGD